MNLCVSNIAWPRECDAAVADLLTDLGIRGIESAPTKIWDNPLAATDGEIAEYRHFWNSRGIEIVAAQALLFGKPELIIFGSADARQRTFEYLAGLVRLCARLGAGALVFGSPKNRRIGSLTPDEANRIAVELFTRLGEVAANADTCLVMEANPPEYGADFVTRAAEAIELVEAVNHPAFRLHLDTACMTITGDPIQETFERGFAWVRHFHVSEPNLEPPGYSGRVDHDSFARLLHRRGYRGWVSLEMREPRPFAIAKFEQDLKWLLDRYGAKRETI